MDYFLKAVTPQDLQVVLTWVPTPELLKLWAGPGLTFPPQADIAWHELGITGENSFSLIDAGGNVAGFGQTLLREPHRVHLARIIVSPTVRGKGVGRILCQQLMQAGLERYGAAAFTLNVYKDNAPAFNLYKSLGFTVVSEDPENNWYRMCLQLRPESPIKE